ncbi:MAG: PadR family transcriptional regulator [Candidatus Bathyarchaeota archaeon]|nr:PadR family transcriptional regulator [Candidatus Bathyarchaeota archaeon]
MKEAQKGYIRIGVLILLNKKPTHGYEIMKEIKDRTKGFWKPTPGGVYPILRSLEKAGYIKGEWQTQKNRKLKVYKITNSGNLILKHAILKQNEITNNISKLFREFSRDVLKVETESFPMPKMAYPFHMFEDDEKAETITELEHQRAHILENIKGMKEKLKRLNKQIAQAKQTEKKNSQKTA